MKNECLLIIFSLPFFLLIISSQGNQCLPFGVRINYGRSAILDDGSKDRLGVRFNTLKQCSNLHILINLTVAHCDYSEFITELLDFSETKIKFRTFVHKCQLKQQFRYGQLYYYNIWNSSNEQKIWDKDIQIKLKDPRNSNQQLSILILADWGPITNPRMQQIYPNISKTLIPLINSGFFDCAIINGDIGYEFNSNQAHHIAVMTAVQQIASKIPIIFNKGNHQRGIVSDMFNEYFQLYNLDRYNATGFQLGATLVMVIDPSNEVWPRERNKFTKSEISSSYDGLNKIMSEFQRKKEKAVPILFVHYPLICGYPTKGHCIPNPRYGQIHPIYINLKHYYDFVIDNNIPLVISGHVHVYQRSYPLISNYRSFSKEKHNYISNNSEQFFIHVIEGVSGNNDGIETAYLLDGKTFQPSVYIANHHENALGFGVLTANKQKITYQHYKLLSDKQIMLIDNFTISFQHSQQSNHQQEL